MMTNPEAVIYFHIPFKLKENLEAEAKSRNLSMTKLINLFIRDSLKRNNTGRGNIDIVELEKVKNFLRLKHPKSVQCVDIAKYIGKPQARTARILDILSGATDVENAYTDFLIYVNDDVKPPTYNIYKDVEKGIFT